MVGWLVGWFVDWLVGWLVGRACVAHDLSSIIGVVTMADDVSTERTECFAIRVEYEERSEFWHWRTVPTEKGYQDNQQCQIKIINSEASSSKCTLRSRPCTYVNEDAHRC